MNALAVIANPKVLIPADQPFPSITETVSDETESETETVPSCINEKL